MTIEKPHGDDSEVDPVVRAADQRIRERGVKEFGDAITLMGLDPGYAPDPLHIIEAGIPPEGEDGDFTLPDDLA